MDINISNCDSENYGPERTLNMIMANQAILSLQTVSKFVETVEGVDISLLKAIGKLNDFVN